MNNFITSTGLRWLWLSAIVFIIALSSNYIVSESLSLVDTVQIISFFNLRYVRNYGTAFSFFANIYGSWLWWFLVSTTSVICSILLFSMYYTESTQTLKNIAYALIIGGALSNLFERLWYGFVIDIIDFYVNDWHFATFNIADSTICIGIALLIIKEYSIKISTKIK